MLGLAAILPVLTSGFLFVVIHYKTRLLASQSEGQRLFFMCAAAGLVMQALAYAVLNWSWVPAPDWLTARIPAISDSDRRQHVLTFLLGPVIALLANFFYALIYWVRVDSNSKSYASNTWEWAISAHIRKSGSPLRRMLVQAVDSNGQKQVLISMASRKVYCGAIRRLPAPQSGEEFIEIIPNFSATRNKDTLKLENKIDYPAFHLWRLQRRMKILQTMIDHSATSDEDRGAALKELNARRDIFRKVAAPAPENYEETFDIDLWAKVIPVKEIESLSLYDEDSNRKWFAGSQPPPSDAAPPEGTASPPDAAPPEGTASPPDAAPAGGAANPPDAAPADGTASPPGAAIAPASAGTRPAGGAGAACSPAERDGQPHG